MTLQAGQKIKLPSGRIMVVEKVSEYGAYITPLVRKTVVLRNADGNVTKEFSAKARGYYISSESSLEVVND